MSVPNEVTFPVPGADHHSISRFANRTLHAYQMVARTIADMLSGSFGRAHRHNAWLTSAQGRP